MLSKFWAFNKHYKTGNRVEEDFAKSVGIEITKTRHGHEKAHTRQTDRLTCDKLPD